MNYVVLDMEWNQAITYADMVKDPVFLTGEIIQIGAVMLNDERKEKIDKIYHRLSSQIRDNSSNQISEYLSTLKTETDKLLKTIDDLFGQLIDGLQDTLVAGDELANAYEIEIDLLNRVYAWRIVTYLAGTIERYSEDKVDNLITSVVRDGNLIQIHTPVAASFHTEELKDIIAEKIEIKNTEA